MLQKLEITFLELGGEEACVGGEGREIGKICFSNLQWQTVKLQRLDICLQVYRQSACEGNKQKYKCTVSSVALYARDS